MALARLLKVCRDIGRRSRRLIIVIMTIAAALSPTPQLSVADSLTEFAYPAALAGKYIHTPHTCMYTYIHTYIHTGLSYELDFTVKGLRLAVGGYSSKIADFARYVCMEGGR